MSSSLPKIELWTYFTVWISGCIYSVFEVYRNSRAFKKSNTWMHNVDGSDTEWKHMSYFMVQSQLPACLVHLLISKIWRKIFGSHLMFEINLIMSTLFYTHIFGPNVVILIYAMGLSFYVISLVKSWILVWVLAGMLRNSVRQGVGGPFGVLWNSSYSDLLRFNIFYVWLIVKGIIYSMDAARDKEGFEPLDWRERTLTNGLRGYIRLMAYFFYIPSTLGSPIIMYKSFYDAMKQDYKPWTPIRIERFVLSLLRYLFWWALMEVIVRTLFFGKMSRKPEYLSKANLWLLCGIAYSSGQFFMLKYTIFYGMIRPFALEDGVDSPEHPKCIARIHSYSAMWRHFDKGLYIFIRDYIYRPLMVDDRRRNSLHWKLFASIVSFVFVFIYHGNYGFVFIWSLLNFIAVSIESLGKWMTKSQTYRGIRDKYLSPIAERRLYCLFATPLLLFSFYANLYFLIGLPSANMYFTRASSLSIKEIAALFFYMYCAIQGSFEIDRQEAFPLKDK